MPIPAVTIDYVMQNVLCKKKPDIEKVSDLSDAIDGK
jgi:hypothetical protein